MTAVDDIGQHLEPLGVLSRRPKAQRRGGKPDRRVIELAHVVDVKQADPRQGPDEPDGDADSAGLMWCTKSVIHT